MTELNMRDRILDAAEARARTGGYNAFSFRDLADDVGIKSASVHYHFPTKAELAEALAQRYTQRARDHLGAANEVGAEVALQRVTSMFRDALVRNDRMCLCGMFGAERDVLPGNVALEVSKFFQLIIDYLHIAFAGDRQFGNPESILAKLEGALIIARSLRNPGLFDLAIR